MKRGYRKEESLYTSDNKLNEDALTHCRITGVDPKELERKTLQHFLPRGRAPDELAHSIAN